MRMSSSNRQISSVKSTYNILFDEIKHYSMKSNIHHRHLYLITNWQIKTIIHAFTQWTFLVNYVIKARATLRYMRRSFLAYSMNVNLNPSFIIAAFSIFRHFKGEKYIVLSARNTNSLIMTLLMTTQFEKKNDFISWLTLIFAKLVFFATSASSILESLKVRDSCEIIMTFWLMYLPESKIVLRWHNASNCYKLRTRVAVF